MFRNMLRSASNARIDARRTRRRRAVPSLQTLEGRALLAASIVYDPIAEDIIITGSNAADVAVVEQDERHAAEPVGRAGRSSRCRTARWAWRSA